MQSRLNITMLILFVCLTMRTVWAHSGDEPPLFVAADGTDAGLCTDPATPCRSIEYALEKVGKGGQIRVAAGQYLVNDSEVLFHLVNGSVDIVGGYDRASGFRVPSQNPTVLTGVPLEFAEPLVERGFAVIADSKGAGRDAYNTVQQKLGLHAALKSSLPAAPCVGGSVAGMACLNVDLLSHVGSTDISAQPGNAADVWGFVDLNTNREYAIVGFDIGTAIFDVTDPENPREVGFVDGQRTSWRDIKVYQYWNNAQERWNAHAYITTDGSTDGLFVIELSDLPHRVSRLAYASDFSAAHNIYLTSTDFGTGLAAGDGAPSIIIAGSNIASGPYRAYSVDNPDAPRFEVMPGSGRADYMHDAASMIITDSRKDTQCINGGSFCELLFDFNETTVDIWDVTNAGGPVRLSRTTYPNVGYVHSGWPTEDQRYLFVQDELDERDRGLNTTLRVFDLSNLSSPVPAGTWTGPTNAIDHNGFVRGNRYYMSNYSRGLTILDITNVTNIQLVGRIDTFPGSDGTGFVGAWGAYPYFHSGHIAISDIDSGFYMVADRTLDVPEGRLAFSSASYGGSEGMQLQIPVSRLGGAVGGVGTRYEILAATANTADVTSAAGSLSWSNGDGADKLITLDLHADADTSEGLERFLVRLSAPTGGATLDAQRVAHVYISEPGAAPSVGFDQDVVRIAERGFATAVLVVRRFGSASGAVSADYTITAGDANAGSDFQGPTSGTLNWDDGDANPKWIEFAIADDGTGETEEFIEVSLGNVSGASIGVLASSTVLIADGFGQNRAPNAVAGTSQTVSSGASVTLNGSASNDPDGDTLTYQWSQISGTAVAINNPGSATAAFSAPSVSSDELLQFELSVSDGLAQDVAATTVTVRRPDTAQSGGSGGGSTGGFALLFMLLLFLTRRIRAAAAATSRQTS